MVEDLKNIIKEELGIHSQVSELAKIVYSNIQKDMQTREKLNSDTCTIKQGEVDCVIKDIKFKISYVCRNFNDDAIIKEITEEALTEGGSAFISKNFIYCHVEILSLCGFINKKLALSTIQHELEHIYQQILSNKRIPSNDVRYAKMRSDMMSNNIDRHNVARLVYICYKSEQEGFINGMYAWCMADDARTKPYDYTSISKSPAGKIYVEAKELFSKLVKNKEMILILKEEYGLTVSDVEKYIQKFLKKIGRVIIKVNNDKTKIWRI